MLGYCDLTFSYALTINNQPVTPSGILHLLIWFWDILGIRDLHHPLSGTLQNPIQARNRAAVAALTQLYPKGNQSSIRVSAAHIGD